MNKKLIDLYLENQDKYKTDKYELGYIDNLYSELFDPYINTPINFLEIGVQNGDSILMWKDYFHPDSKIHTLDIKFCEIISSIPNVIQRVSDAYCEKSLSLFENDFFNIIVDDGLHTYTSFEFLIQNYYDKLKIGGIMVIEDIVNLSWIFELKSLANKIGYSNVKEIITTDFLKTDIVKERWKNGLAVLILTK
jgi:SAM-dependent methyltransferase